MELKSQQTVRAPRRGQRGYARQDPLPNDITHSFYLLLFHLLMYSVFSTGGSLMPILSISEYGR